MRPGAITPADVRAYTGVKPGSLDLETEQDLDAMLSGWIGRAETHVSRFVGGPPGRLFDPVTSDPVPPEAASAVLRIVGNMVAQAKVRRQTSILSINEYRQMLVPDAIFPRSIKRDLLPLRALPTLDGYPRSRGDLL